MLYFIPAQRAAGRASFCHFFPILFNFLSLVRKAFYNRKVEGT